MLNTNLPSFIVYNKENKAYDKGTTNGILLIETFVMHETNHQMRQ